MIQKTVFESFLRALYDLPYRFTSIEQLLVMAEFARFYRVLPKISRSLTEAIHASTDDFKKGLTEPSIEMLDAAIDFRHRGLFMEMMCWISGYHPFQGYGEMKLDAEQPAIPLQVIALNERIHTRLDQKLTAIHTALMLESYQAPRRDMKDFVESAWRSMANSVGRSQTVASVYRSMHGSLFA